MTYPLNCNYIWTTNRNKPFGKMQETNWEEETKMTIRFNTKSMVKLKKQTQNCTIGYLIYKLSITPSRNIFFKSTRCVICSTVQFSIL